MRKKDWKRVVTTAIAATMCVGTFNVFGGETQTTEIDWYSSVAGWGTCRMEKRCDRFSVDFGIKGKIWNYIKH